MYYMFDRDYRYARDSHLIGCEAKPLITVNGSVGRIK